MDMNKKCIFCLLIMLVCSTIYAGDVSINELDEEKCNSKAKSLLVYIENVLPHLFDVDRQDIPSLPSVIDASIIDNLSDYQDSGSGLTFYMEQQSNILKGFDNIG